MKKLLGLAFALLLIGCTQPAPTPVAPPPTSQVENPKPALPTPAPSNGGDVSNVTRDPVPDRSTSTPDNGDDHRPARGRDDLKAKKPAK